MEENTMKAEELRIGNFLDRNGLMEVVGIKIHAIKIYDHYNKIANPTWFQPEGFKGIPLTPEWLKRLSFKKVKNESDGAIWQNKKIVLKYSVGSFRLFISDTEDDWYYTTSIVVETVHRLQNIFHSLTGKELTLKP